ncbi:MAG: hypothetical protein M1162_02735 [Candidatus Thermoplasmatota archaeon]|jgi:hypothetical protein|nr:hypothetical protein [Candidatus Thermoplasmatota archaeon]
MPKESRRYGNLILGVITGVAFIVVVGSQNHAFWLIFAGLAAGLVSRGVVRGTVTALIAGLIILIIVSVLAALKDASPVYSLLSQVKSSGFLYGILDNLYTLVYYVGYNNLNKLMEILVIDAVVLPTIGGFIGGSIKPGY